MVTLLFIFLLAASSSNAQAPGNAPQGEPSAQANQGDNWKEQLGLTTDQMTKIRAIREQNRVESQPIRRRVNQAQRALDMAIYSDNVNEAEIEQRARELAEAQAAEVHMRAMTELSIRRVLTPEQLNTFRTIRQQRMRDAQLKRRQENGNAQGPLKNRRLENGANQPASRITDGSRPVGNGQGGQGANPTPGPRERRGGGVLPRRIRP
jgi:Spy/CpxP family protein refolding chaperone